MLIVPKKPFLRRRTASRPKPVPPPVALNLIAAVYQDSEWIQLSFDRPIDITSLSPGQITVNDVGPSGTLWEGVGPATLIDPVTVRITLGAFDPSSGTETTLSATTATGIVASGDGGAWSGASNLALPFP